MSSSVLSQVLDGVLQLLPVGVHPPELRPAAVRQLVVLTGRAAGRFFDRGFQVLLRPQPAQNRVDRPLGDDEAVDLAETFDQLVAVEPPSAEGVQNRELQESLAKLRGPVFVEWLAHESNMRRYMVLVNT